MNLGHEQLMFQMSYIQLNDKVLKSFNTCVYRIIEYTNRLKH
jgi:hypothetical protein